MIEMVVIAALLGLLPAAIAHAKGRDFFTWYFYGFLLFIVAIIHAALMPTDEAALDRRRLRTGAAKKCPHCAEVVKLEAKVCRHCGNRLDVTDRFGNVQTLTGGRQGSFVVLAWGPGSPYQVVGESFFQDALERAVGGKRKDSAPIAVTARLVPEDDNEHDDHAVRVEVFEEKVGYLEREDAERYRRDLSKQGATGAIGVCHAVVTGGWRDDEGEGHFGVELRLADPLTVEA